MARRAAATTSAATTGSSDVATSAATSGPSDAATTGPSNATSAAVSGPDRPALCLYTARRNLGLIKNPITHSCACLPNNLYQRDTYHRIGNNTI